MKYLVVSGYCRDYNVRISYEKMWNRWSLLNHRYEINLLQHKNKNERQIMKTTRILSLRPRRNRNSIKTFKAKIIKKKLFRNLLKLVESNLFMLNSNLQPSQEPSTQITQIPIN